MRTMVHLLRRYFEEERGQGTVEYILIVLASAPMATALLAWIGNTAMLPNFFNAALRHAQGVIGR